MSALEFDVTAQNKRAGRTVKFTPERMDQIQNLVEHGHNREEIAAIIGCTVGSLQVTCSRFGISLRRIDPRRAPMTVDDDTSGNGKRRLEPSDFAPQKQTQPGKFSLRAIYNNRTYDIPLPLDHDTFAMLAVCAELRGMRLGELIAHILAQGVAAEIER